jgi:hypothetical protein
VREIQRGWETSTKGQMVKILDFVDHKCLSHLPDFCCSSQSFMDNTETSKICLQKYVGRDFTCKLWLADSWSRLKKVMDNILVMPNEPKSVLYL